MTLQTQLFDFPILVEAQKLDEGWDISITGGCRSHVGAVTLAAPGEEPQTIQRRRHKDACISQVWAETLVEKWNCPVCVRCGIHYDGLSMEQIQEIIKASNALLAEIGG